MRPDPGAVSRAGEPAPTKHLIDAHVHVAALDDGKNGCHIDPAFRRGLVGRLLQRWMRLPTQGGPHALNTTYVSRLLEALRASRHVARAVLLALDAVHEEDGTRRLDRSSLVVSNDYVLELARLHPELLPAASVHPYRRDALAELERVREAGAVLIKLLPVSQVFDPADPRTRPFWKTCARLRLPVLSHTGSEFTLARHVQRYGDPARLELGLSEGATVIAAHACSRGLPFGEIHLPTFRRLADRYPEFLADTSALTLPGRMPMLWRLRREPQLASRLIFATDYPVPPSALPLLGRVSPAAYRRVAREANPFDKPVRVMKELGLEPTSEPLVARLRLGRAG